MPIGGASLSHQAIAQQAGIDAIQAETDKIDNAVTDGLTGVSNSLAYRTNEIERHLHSYERWFETAAVPDGEVHVADAIGSGSGAFQIDAGNDDWGAWVQFIGSSDTPAIAGSAFYHCHRWQISAAERNAIYFVQMAFGASGAAALAAGTYSEAVYRPLSNQVESGPVVIQSRRETAGTLAWARTMCPGQNTATLDFFVGVHEYEG